MGSYCAIYTYFVIMLLWYYAYIGYIMIFRLFGHTVILEQMKYKYFKYFCTYSIYKLLLSYWADM